jgi:predicted Fe-Mo cluster-binding NifX family protein
MQSRNSDQNCRFSRNLRHFLLRHGSRNWSRNMETVAVTQWNDIVSPLYDSSCHLLIVGPDGNRSVFDIRNMSSVRKAELCVTHSVAVLICGAISKPAEMLLTNRGITVLSWIRGPIAELLDAYRNRRDLAVDYYMPGFGCGKRRCRGRRRLNTRVNGMR